jgi:hypothetical protein
VVTDGHAIHVGADRLHHTCALVPEDGRAHRLRRPVDRIPVRVADAARVQPHEHFFRSGWCELELGHDERPTRLLQDDSADLHAAVVSLR